MCSSRRNIQLLGKKARLEPVFQKDDAADVSNYRAISLFSVPSKIMESCVSDTIVRHVFENNLITYKQWSYREGHSTELMSVHLSETWRRAMGENNVKAGSVLGPTLFALYTNDQPTAVFSDTLLIYADDTTLYCIGDPVDDALTLLNEELHRITQLVLGK